jgi:Fe-S-cluster containining protein
MTPLGPDDDASQYVTATLLKPGESPQVILDRQSNGDCIYLAESGCTIWEHAPKVCREFDCRVTFSGSDRAGRRLAIKRGEMSKEIFERGRELLK